MEGNMIIFPTYVSYYVHTGVDKAEKTNDNDEVCTEYS